ncbi:hypothetical protein NUW58_g8795 [Xylaria curta]|uniref:Uncharacterized protein n=1 Tax=Xylaria curta TaxID=42375 RepID=A0ACC1N5F1_9PEZI|nr:hypothetical protein NUW58_g8795 [Xylaria curta]
MGGKVWTDAEERYFWRVTISQSPKRVGFDLANMEKSWDQLARDLQDAMGIDARRNYSGTMLCMFANCSLHLFVLKFTPQDPH